MFSDLRPALNLTRTSLVVLPTTLEPIHVVLADDYKDPVPELELR